MSDLTPQGVARLLQEGDAELIDVREPHEYEAGRISGSRPIPLGELTAAAASIGRERPVVFVCRSGGRSGMATEAFARAGYDARNLEGGLQAWEAAGLPLEPADGTVA